MLYKLPRLAVLQEFARALILALLFAASAAKSDELAKFPGAQFGSEKASFDTLWLNAELKETIETEFSYSLDRLRVRFWRCEAATAWILEEIGKEQPITFGIIVNDEKIQSIEVLTYRESRGGEIRHSFFRKQFIGATLNLNNKKQSLNQNIDGITGATLSVNAMKKVAMVAIFLHKHALSSK